MSVLRVLGIDPGSVVAGWGVVERHGSRLVLVESGVLRPPKGASFPLRLRALHEGIEAILVRLQPDSVAVEAVFHSQHARSALQLGHARGVFLLAAAQAGLEVAEYPPAAVKKAVTGDGQADKEAVRKMVDRLLEAPTTGPLDRSDALAVAICHAWSAPLRDAAKAVDRAASRPPTAGPRLRRTRG